MTDEPISEKWLPQEWLDEIVPLPQEDPSAFIRGPVGDRWLVIDTDDDPDDTPWQMTVAPGDIVDFKLCRTWTAIEVEIGAGGELLRHDPVPKGATLFMVEFDPDTMGDTLGDLAKCWIYFGCDPGVVEVVPYDWSNTAKFRLVVDASAAAGARFEKVEEAPDA